MVDQALHEHSASLPTSGHANRSRRLRTAPDIDEKIRNAVSLHSQGKLLDAQNIYEYIITLNPYHFEALQLLGLLSYQIGQFDRAVQLLLRAIEMNDKFAFVHRNLGDAFERLNRLDSAIASYDRAISLDPADAAAYNNRGIALKKLNRFDAAVANFNKAISLKHDYADAYNNLGVALNESKRHAEALANFEKAVRLKPDLSQVSDNVGAALADLAQWNLLLWYKGVFGVLPRLNPPISFNERILHRIIYERDPKLRIVCDKIAVRRLIEERVGVEYVVPLLGVWERPTEITWQALPQKFVIKPSHSSGPFAIVDRSIEIKIEQLTAEAERWLSYDYFDKSLEWGYRGVPRRILAEPFLYSSNGGAAPEAQVHTFTGRAALIDVLVGAKRTPDRREFWFDVTGRRVMYKLTGPHAEFELPESDRHKMVEIAERVSQGFSSLRVDFYITKDGLKIGELSPYTWGGRYKWDPPELDEKIGQLWDPNRDLSIIPDYI